MVTKSLLILLLIFLSYVCEIVFPEHVYIVGLFQEQDKKFQQMFESSIRAVNRDGQKKEELSNVILIPQTEEIKADPFEVSLKVCELLDLEIVGVFGPQEKVIAEHVQSICDTVEVPHISVRHDSDEPSQPRGLALNLYPHVNSLSRVYDQLVTEFKWKSFAILYENTESLIRMRILFKRRNAQKHFVFVYHLGYGQNYRKGMQEIKASNIENIIIDCSYEILNEVLKQAQQVGILSDKYKVIVTNLDLQTLDLEPYQYSGVNLTGVRLIDPEDPIVLETLGRHRNEWGLDDPSQLQVEPALMYDAVQLFARAFKQLKNATTGDTKKLSCDGDSRWEHGLSLSNFMRSTETKGLTGLVKFDRDGFRNNIELDIVRLTENGLTKIGEWNSIAGKSIDWLPEINTQKSDFKLNIQNRTLIVLISMTPPYGMQKESMAMLTGNERYEGFAIDIIQQLSEILEFNYTLQEENDYGKCNNKTGKWSGMLGKIMADEADLAITDLTITSARTKVVDFTMPIMNLGISILFKKPTKAPPNLFSFLSPFSNEVWLYLIGAYIIVSILLFVVGRLCPAEWNNPYPCIEEAEMLENQFTIKNAFWFAIGSIMQQGSEIAPIGISTRMIASCWWFFCLIIVSSYTANLAAFLTVETVMLPFNNVEELAKKTGIIKYGAKNGGSTLDFFKGSTHDTYQQMYKYMKENEDDVLVKENENGLEKTKKEDYAFLMESSSIEYLVERNCDVTQIGDLLDEKGYGIALKKTLKRADVSPDKGCEFGGPCIYGSWGTVDIALLLRWCRLRRVDGNARVCVHASRTLIEGGEMGLELRGSFVLKSGRQGRLRRGGRNKIRDSEYRLKLNAAILKLSESGTLNEMKKKWWTQKRGGGKCRENGGDKGTALNFANVGGVFLVLIVGVLLSCVYTIFELLWDVARTSSRKNVPFKEELINELKFIVKCSNSKSVRKNGLSNKSEDGSTRGCTPPYGFIPTVIRTSPIDDK